MPLSRWTDKFPGLHPIGSYLLRCHLLVSQEEAILIDTGLWREPRQVQGVLHELGLPLSFVKAILLTHGHLDHAANVQWYREHTAAEIWAHPADQAHLEGTFAYTGPARVCGALERVGRRLLRYHSGAIDHPLVDGETLPFWGGLRVIHLPGHTSGHCGFYSETHQLLFTGDLFACYRRARLPPSILNSCPKQIPASLAKIRALDPRWVLPNHFAGQGPERVKLQFDRMMQALNL